MIEFIFWMCCLIAPPCALLATVLGLWRRWLLVAACGSAVLFTCCERISSDCWPNQMSDSSATRFLRYISLRVIYEDERFYSDKPHLFPMVPHGIFPASVFGFLIVQPRLPCVRVVGAQASATFYFPYWRQFSRWLGSVHAKGRSIVGVLRGGRSCCTFMDGIHGMFAGTMGAKERLFVSGKKGLVRIALQTGTPLVPCYCFGQTRLVRTGQDRFGLMMALSRRLKARAAGRCRGSCGTIADRLLAPQVSLVLPLGRGLLPIPFRTPLTIALGTPIEVPPRTLPLASWSGADTLLLPSS